MFDRKTLLVGFLSFSTVLGFHMLFRNWFEPTAPAASTAVSLGGSYRVPSQQDLSLPMKKTVTFDASIDAEESEFIWVKTEKYNAQFTTVGGTIETLSYPAYHDTSGAEFKTINSAAGLQEASFLVALNDTAPLHYKHEATKTYENGDVAVTFAARSDDWIIRKTFLLHNNVYRIDLIVEFKNKNAHPSPVRPRVMIGAPRLEGLKVDATHGVSFDQKKVTLTKVNDAQRATDAWVVPQLIGVENTYFAHVLVADPDGFAQRGYFSGAEASSVSAILEGPALTDSMVYNLSFYVGPKSRDALIAVDSRLEGLLDFGWLSWFAKLLLQLLEWMYKLCHNYGLAIILSTILLKILFLPLSLKSARYMAEQQKLQPRVAALRKKFAHDTAQFNVELMRLYKEHNMSPAAPLFGCLLMIPQWPLFFAMYRVLGNVIDVYQAPFFGWITDLSAKDPYYVLPAIVVILTFMQPFGSVSQNNDSRAQLMRYLMPALLAALFVNMPAGLLLFVITNFGFSLGEQKMRSMLSA